MDFIELCVGNQVTALSRIVRMMIATPQFGTTKWIAFSTASIGRDSHSVAPHRPYSITSPRCAGAPATCTASSCDRIFGPMKRDHLILGLAVRLEHAPADGDDGSHAAVGSRR